MTKISKSFTILALRPASLAGIEAQLRDGGGEERQPPPRKFVFADERASPIAAPSTPWQKLEVWTGQEPGERIANTILLCAIRDQARQVTLEPDAKSVKVRFEIENGVREQRLPAFALEPIVRYFTALVGEADKTKVQLPGEVRIAVDEQFYDVQFLPMQTQWGDGVKVRLSPH